MSTYRHRPLRSSLALAAVASVATLALAGCASGLDAATSTPPASPATAPVSLAPDVNALQQQYVQVAKQVGQSVVLVKSNKGLGSGVVFDDQGDIVTNNHVVAGSSDFSVILPDGKEYTAQVVGTFAPDDLAVLHINASGLTPASFADSSKLAVGDITLAIGNPLGLQSSVTEGIVSALGRTVNEDSTVALPDVIQTSAAINPGNSGGALVDLQGQVIGIPTLTATDPQLGGGQAPGIGFAIPSNTVQDIAAQLVDHGTVSDSHRAYLGVDAATTTSGGPLVSSVQAGGPAADAGIHTGDRITMIDGTATPDQATMADVLAGLKPGQTVVVRVITADGATQSLPVTLGQYPG